jgi:N-acetyl-alpha-D-glucosaminyl L-malate synthase BshA
METEVRRIGITCYPTPGGSGIVATELGIRLARKGYEVHFISHSLPVRLREFSENIFFHEVHTENYPVFQHQPYVLSLAARMAEVADFHKLQVLHVHYALPHATAAYLARGMLRPQRICIVTTLHGTDITLVGAHPSFHRITRFSIEKSNRVTAVSRFLREETYRLFNVTRDIDVIYNFVDTDQFRPDRGRLSRSHFAAPGESIVMHASNFRPVKKLDTVIAAFARIRKARAAKLVLVGDGPERPRAEQWAREAGVLDDIAFLGNRDCVEDLLPLADVFVLPSANESFGLVALEAMSSGVPVVVTRVGGTGEVVLDGDCGYLVDPDDPEMVAARCLDLLGDEEKRRAFGRCGRERAVKDFHVDRLVEQYEKVYECAFEAADRKP